MNARDCVQLLVCKDMNGEKTLVKKLFPADPACYRPTQIETGVKKQGAIIKQFSYTHYMAFKLIKGKTKIEWFPVTTSTVLAADSLVEFTSGLIAAADADEAAVDIRGVLVKAIAATDADYATARKVGVRVPVSRHCVWEADGTGTFVATDIGTEFGISDASTVDKAETTADAFLMTEFISATKIRGYLKINGSY